MASDKERGDVLSAKFDSSNHDVWWFHFKLFVEGKGLWGLVDGSETEPAATQVKTLRWWKIDNAKIISWILSFVHVSIDISKQGFQKAKEMWDYLEKV